MVSTSCFSETLNIGSSKYNPPFETWASDNSVYGYDIDFMMEICKRLNVTCQFHPYSFDNIFNALKEKKIDLVISSIIITPNRQKEFLFSLPYLESNAQYLTANYSDINTLAELYGKRIGVKKGAAYAELAASANQNYTIVEYSMLEDMFLALQNEDIDACLIDYESAKYWVAINPGIYKFIGGKIPIGTGYAIMANPDQGPLIKEINRIILEMESDGTFLRIYSQYF